MDLQSYKILERIRNLYDIGTLAKAILSTVNSAYKQSQPSEKFSTDEGSGIPNLIDKMQYFLEWLFKRDKESHTEIMKIFEIMLQNLPYKLVVDTDKLEHVDSPTAMLNLAKEGGESLSAFAEFIKNQNITPIQYQIILKELEEGKLAHDQAIQALKDHFEGLIK